jgi:predicted DNA-binding protein with PD1-like motif
MRYLGPVNHRASILALALITTTDSFSQTEVKPRSGIVEEAVDTYRKQLDLQLRPPPETNAPERTQPKLFSSASRLHVVRLRPGDDLVESLQSLARTGKHKALAIVTCVGSLTKASVRFANASAAAQLDGPFEIVSLVGTLSEQGSHLHACLADNRGQALGGHLKPGCLVYTTVEVVLIEPTDLEFGRAPDPTTGYPELDIRERRSSPAPGKRRSKSR